MTMSMQLAAQYEAEAERYAEEARQASNPTSAAFWQGEADRARETAAKIRGNRG